MAKRRYRLISRWFLTIFIGCGFVSGAALYKPLPQIEAPVINTKTLSPAHAPVLDWPLRGAAAIGATHYADVLGQSGNQEAKPIASIAKLMVALAVIKQKPLKVNVPGPIITISQEDINYYYNHLNQGGSVVPVNFGEQISQYQALQALLIASGNNIAETLVRWAFGSVEAYQTYAKQLAVDLGLKNSTFLDPSGLADNTTSTPEDLLTLAQAVLKEPVLKQIVGQTEATIPVAGTIKSTNKLLGQEGIIGIKTGHTDEAGGCLLFAATQNISGKAVTITGVVLGESSISHALNSSLVLAKSTFSNFESLNPIKVNQSIATYTSPWGSKATVVAQKDINLVRWPADTLILKTSLQTISSKTQKGARVGEATVIYGSQNQKVELILQETLGQPSFWWRLRHLFDF